MPGCGHRGSGVGVYDVSRILHGLVHLGSALFHQDHAQIRGQPVLRQMMQVRDGAASSVGDHDLVIPLERAGPEAGILIFPGADHFPAAQALSVDRAPCHILRFLDSLVDDHIRRRDLRYRCAEFSLIHKPLQLVAVGSFRHGKIRDLAGCPAGLLRGRLRLIRGVKRGLAGVGSAEHAAEVQLSIMAPGQRVQDRIVFLAGDLLDQFLPDADPCFAVQGQKYGRGIRRFDQPLQDSRALVQGCPVQMHQSQNDVHFLAFRSPQEKVRELRAEVFHVLPDMVMDQPVRILAPLPVQADESPAKVIAVSGIQDLEYVGDGALQDPLILLRRLKHTRQPVQGIRDHTALIHVLKVGPGQVFAQEAVEQRKAGTASRELVCPAVPAEAPCGRRDLRHKIVLVDDVDDAVVSLGRRVRSEVPVHALRGREQIGEDMIRGQSELGGIDQIRRQQIADGRASAVAGDQEPGIRIVQAVLFQIVRQCGENGRCRNGEALVPCSGPHPEIAGPLSTVSASADHDRHEVLLRPADLDLLRPDGIGCLVLGVAQRRVVIDEQQIIEAQQPERGADILLPSDFFIGRIVILRVLGTPAGHFQPQRKLRDIISEAVAAAGEQLVRVPEDQALVHLPRYRE